MPKASISRLKRLKASHTSYIDYDNTLAVPHHHAVGPSKLWMVSMESNR